MQPSLAPLYEIFKLNSRLFLNCLDGMDEGQARWRPSGATNSAGYIALHLADTRYLLARMVGLDATSPFAALTDGAKSIDDIKSLPSLDDIRAAWKAVTGELRERFKVMTDADLARAASQKLPVEDMSTLGAITFLMQHDTYHIGQLGLLRKQAGLGAMGYR